MVHLIHKFKKVKMISLIRATEIEIGKECSCGAREYNRNILVKENFWANTILEGKLKSNLLGIPITQQDRDNARTIKKLFENLK